MIAGALLAIALGSTVHWTDGATGEVFCGKLTAVDEVRGGRAWILPSISPHWLAVVPLSLVSEGCPRP